MMRSCAVMVLLGLVAGTAVISFIVWPGWATVLPLAVIIGLGRLLPPIWKWWRIRKLATTADSLRTRSQADPERHLPQLAAALDQHARALLGTGRVEQALKVSAERIGHHRSLLDRAPDRRREHLDDFADALDAHQVMLQLAGRPQEALEVNAEALRIRKEGLGQWRGGPDHERDVAMTLATRAGLLTVAERHDEALATSQEALAALRTISARDDHRHLPALAGVLDIRATCELAAGREQDALMDAQEAVECCERLINLYRGEYLHLLARVTGTRAKILCRTDPDEAISSSGRMVQVTQSAARQDALAYTPALLSALTAHALVLSAAGRTRDGRRFARKAISLSRRTVPELLVQTRQQLTGPGELAA
ncbi:tetratricopeptide repeat protein [Nonomuraea angiospora]|uniref:Tetratricopeptide (TPR) repeat protein n=1 Tax=Nonomuraea angiospora TaxID=46172 RepID=A0ABR9MKG4_9ACTN|nr:hypothetical protein [Nonomuraea angiospora]MBE1593388.1 tetratricopeptide (TPR) repeat protein [Nonomuraea angiospora]